MTRVRQIRSFFKRVDLILQYAVVSGLLASCRPLGQPPVTPPLVHIDAEGNVVIFDNEVLLQAGLPQTSFPAEAVAAKFFIGAWESPRVQDSRLQYTRFVCTVENTCLTLPQGETLPARYEIYDPENTLVKQDEVLIQVTTGPGSVP